MKSTNAFHIWVVVEDYALFDMGAQKEYGRCQDGMKYPKKIDRPQTVQETFKMNAFQHATVIDLR